VSRQEFDFLGRESTPEAKKCPRVGRSSREREKTEGGSVNSFLAAALTRVMRASVPIPSVASASVLHSAVVGGSVVGVVRPLETFGESNNCELGVCRFLMFLTPLAEVTP